jgi:hypothetical protein
VTTRTVAIAGGLALAVGGWLGAARLEAQPSRTLRDPRAFSGIADRTRRSVALFTEAGKVFGHPRCVNCHAAATGRGRASGAIRTSRR